MRHAYLILAHNEPHALERLITAIDDARNDIFVHIDKKADISLFRFSTKRSRLTFLSERIDCRWGDFSLVEAELLLLKAARAQGDYACLHLLSGVDMAVKSQDEIHDACAAQPDTLFIGYAQNATAAELQWRSQHRFPFARRFRSQDLFVRLFRRAVVALQSVAGYRRYRGEVRKGSQWWSITAAFADYVLSREDEIRKHFRGTYCPDEMVFQTLCWNSPFRANLFRTDDEFAGCRRFIKWQDGELLPLSAADAEQMRLSDRWFARKVSGDVVDEMYRLVNA